MFTIQAKQPPYKNCKHFRWYSLLSVFFWHLKQRIFDDIAVRAEFYEQYRVIYFLIYLINEYIVFTM